MLDAGAIRLLTSAIRHLTSAFMNYRLTIEYDGTDFHGWQMQGSLRTVQGELTRALSRIDGRDVVVHGAGRTDAGVHAAGQVASVHLLREIPAEKLRAAINGNTARDVRVTHVAPAHEDFHARFSARGKTYRYRIFNGPFISPFWVRYADHEARFLDLGEMQRAARLFIGEHDWSAFSAAHSDAASRVRRLTEVEVKERPCASEGARVRLIEIIVSGEGFLRYMVRSIVGTLSEVGHGRVTMEDVLSAIRPGNRSLAGATAPACGLTLLKVHYDEDVGC